ncbi:germin-like protein subfamily 2 member 4 [Quercus suber]|uniref:Germin-like protein n=1 Tax=Quercus suber TaxID=58331 RepID=A0AAW0LYD7_QUESU
MTFSYKFMNQNTLRSISACGRAKAFCCHLGARFSYACIKNEGPSTTLKVSKVSLAEFSALNGQSVSYAVLEYLAGTTNLPHIHPRASELLFVVEGTLQVGFVDTTNKLFTQTLQTGDIFVFPKGLVHFQYNADAQIPVVAIAAFGSANAGTVSIPNTLFTTGIDAVVLAKSFKTNTTTIEALKAGLAPPTPRG